MIGFPPANHPGLAWRQRTLSLPMGWCARRSRGAAGPRSHHLRPFGARRVIPTLVSRSSDSGTMRRRFGMSQAVALLHHHVRGVVERAGRGAPRERRDGVATRVERRGQRVAGVGEPRAENGADVGPAEAVGRHAQELRRSAVFLPLSIASRFLTASEIVDSPVSVGYGVALRRNLRTPRALVERSDEALLAEIYRDGGR
jgi:hypothetical protein